MSLDDSQINYSISSTDWKAKYNEVADMLAETRTELDDFHHASKELEAELENELQRTEKAQQELKIKVVRAESEREEWKAKFMSLQTNHNTTITSLQRELDKIRQEYQQTKVQLRDLEMGNDDLERTERAVSSSLADMEAKYSRALEEKILLEHELLEKASLEEESQRLRDELRDANVEIAILKDQIATRNSSSNTEITSVDVSSSHCPRISLSSDDDLLKTSPPEDLQLSELLPSFETLPSNTTPKASARIGGQSAVLRRAGFQPNQPNGATPNTSRVIRSSTLPSLYSPSRSSPRTPTLRPPSKSRITPTDTTPIPTPISRNKGVQMVSEMRARVRNLEQKIHTRVPRLRLASITGRSNTNSLALSTLIASSGASSSSNKSSTKTSWESPDHRRSVDSKHSNDSGPENNQKISGDSSGWVLIMEDSPSPPKEKERDRRRISGPSGGPTAFRPASHSSIPSPTLGSSNSNPGIRRPQSRLSAGSLSTTTTSSIPTPTSRPATPTFLPVPSSGLYAHTSTAGVTGLKRSTGPSGPNPYSQMKRSSLGSSTVMPSSRPASGKPISSASEYSHESGKDLPHLPGHHSNITMRPSSKLPLENGSSMLSHSRIGRPTGGGLSGRRSTDNATDSLKPDSRLRSGSIVSAPTMDGLT